MNYHSNDDDYYDEEELAHARRIWYTVNMIILFLVVVAALYLIFNSILPDLAWCRENYSASQIPHCYFYENSIFGRFINPVSGLTLPW